MTSVLLIDDDSVFTDLLKRQLEKSGLRCITAIGGEDALLKMDTDPFDYATLDLNLGQDNGLAYIPKLLDKDPQIKIIIVTGFASFQTAVDAIKLGAWQYLPKPIRAKDIMDLIGDIPLPPPASLPALDTLEREHIQSAMQQCNYNISKAAHLLGISRRTLQRKLKKRIF